MNGLEEMWQLCMGYTQGDCMEAEELDRELTRIIGNENAVEKVEETGSAQTASKRRYRVQSEGYHDEVLCSDVQAIPDPEQERQRMREIARKKLDLVRTRHPGRGGATLLHAAARKGSVKLTRWLLARGADVVAKDSGGFSALHVAARHDQHQIVGLLLDKGGAKLARIRSTLTRETAWDIAKWSGAQGVEKLIMNRTATQRMRELQDYSRTKKMIEEEEKRKSS